MLPLPSDPTFGQYVDALRRGGASMQTIASALNQSAWADPNGKRWHARQVESLFGARAAAAARDEDAAETGTPRRLALLRLVRQWRSLDGWDIDQIWAWHEAGDRTDVIARRLNRAGTAAPHGRSWTGFWVTLLLYVRLVTEAGDVDADAEGTWLAAAA